MKPSSDSFGWCKPSNKSDPLSCVRSLALDIEAHLLIPINLLSSHWSSFADPNQPPVFTHWHLPPATWTMKSLPISSMTITWPNLLNCSNTTVVLDSDSLVGDTLAFQCNKWSPVISTNISFWAHCDQFVCKEWHITSPMYVTMTLLKKLLLKRLLLIPGHWLE